MIIIIMKNLNGCCSHGHHGSKRCELVQHARGSHSDLLTCLVLGVYLLDSSGSYMNQTGTVLRFAALAILDFIA